MKDKPFAPKPTPAPADGWLGFDSRDCRQNAEHTCPCVVPVGVCELIPMLPLAEVQSS